MRNELRVNQLSDEAFKWYLGYLEAIDSTDIDRYGEYLADDCEFQFGNQPKVVGKQNIIDGLSQFWQSYNGEEHVLQNIFGTDEHFVLEALNIFHRHDGTSVTCPAVAITERNKQGEVTSIRVFIDIKPLYE
ncbi:MAG: nuclear transport factor 2 family protein [Acidobacteria bacterium]|nr:nuclear transport factor 2 family protein [Acidobacteriota bacterium]MCW5949970.1 nuclear transport factor 2 family protein [Pyrinomonadaceae bacterium]